MNKEEGKGIKIIRPQKGFQEKFVRSNCDVVVGGGVMNSGKSYGAILSIAEPSLDPNFRAVFIRRNLGDTKVGGGMLDDMKKAYKGMITSKESDSPRVTFQNGSFIDLTHIADERPDKLLERIKGWQYDMIYFDEGTSYEWTTFLSLFSRNRGEAKWTGKIRMTTNPKRSHWLRIFLDWYIGADGYIIPERNGIVRYFYINGEKVTDVVWGDSKKEVYRKCKIDIDRKLSKIGGDFTYEDLIKSFTFYLGNISENKASIGTNSGYVGNVAAMGGRRAQANLEGNWNVDPEEELDTPIQSVKANEVFLNDHQRNGDKWITADLADTGTDNMIALIWDGFHVIDYRIVGRSTPRQNAQLLMELAAKHGIADSHIIYDGVNGAYMKDYIDEAISFRGFSTSCGLYARMAYKLKDECYLRLINMINNNRLSFSDEVSQATYTHQKLKNDITIQTEFLEECSVVRFKDMNSGQKCLLNKKEMNSMLGKGRSMDLLDPCAMRMYPVLQYQYGEEREMSMVSHEENSHDEYNPFGRESIYDESFWC